ncbi:MAG: helix-turn-helix domain-containing protein [Solirubrobacteraceae bacterium]
MTTTLLGSTLRSVRDAHGFATRELARRAGISHTQVSRIESGEVASPSREVVVRIAQALDRNPGPLLVLAGHLRDDRARLVLAPMFRPGAELPEAWLNEPLLPLDEAMAIVADARSTQEDLMRVAASVVEVPESDETLWDPSHAQYLTVGDEDEELELLGIWRYVRGKRRAEFLRYGRALRELEDLDYIAERDRMDRDDVHEQVVGAELPRAFDRQALESAGFAGFAGVDGLKDGCPGLPESPGVYVVLRVSSEPVSFLAKSAGGRFKGKDPSLDAARLEGEWIEGAEALYVGSAGNLRRRVDQLVRFGRGEPIGHWGGRALWQLSDHARLIVAWQVTDDPVGREAALLRGFQEQFGRLPFANLRMVKA